MKRINTLVITLLCFITSFQIHAQQQERILLKHGAHRIGKRTDANMQRWREYGLGQFIHWGVYAIPGGQWNGKTSSYAAEWFRSSGSTNTITYTHNLTPQNLMLNNGQSKWVLNT